MTQASASPSLKGYPEGHLEPNDTQPGGQPNRTVTIQLTRDTLILIAALAFLAIAILLAVIFPGASNVNQTPSATAVAQANTATGTAASPTAETANLTALAVASPTLPPTEASYPAPNENPLEQPTAPIAGSSELTTPAGNGIPGPAGGEPATAQPGFGPTTIPAFQPTRVQQGAAGGTGGELTQQASTPAYPPPGTQPIASTTPGGVPGAPRTPAASTEVPLFPDAATPPLAPTQPPPPPIQQPQPTTRPAAPVATARPPTPRPTRAPTPIPVDVLRGTIRWTAAKSPIVLRRDQRLVPGATLIVEPGVEVRLAPGVSFFVEGTLSAIGKPDQPVRFVGNERQRWEGLFGRPGSTITLEYTEIHGGGAGGTLLTSEGGSLALRNAHINDNGGHIQVTDSRLEMRDSEIAGNDMPYGSAVEASYSSGGFVTLTGNRIGGNRLQAGTSPVRISNGSSLDTVSLDVQHNLLVGAEGPDLVLATNGPLQGGLTCNTLIAGTNGLSVRSEMPQVPGFALNIRDNATEQHTPPIIPIYLKYGIGRGATSEIALDMRNNWWGSPLGPYQPNRHADGRGEAVGDNIEFGPWLTARPACAPTQ
ncbi:MAG TPA: right-handed parallel beta-helix repeat-containing protein [Roseiflexaceae bacterium]